MPGLIIDWTALELAFESHVPDQRCFLERSTGALRHDGDPELGDADPTRFVRVEAVPSREQYRMMERFIATVTHQALKDALQDAIVGKGAFRRFKDAVGRHPEERKRWFAFRDALLRRFILDWLKTARIELQEMPDWNLEPPMTPSPEATASSLQSGEGEPVTGAPAPAVVEGDRGDPGALRTYLLAWARAHGEEYRYLFGPAAFARLADDLGHEFIIYRKRSVLP
ncbi:MAG: hypothetical protein FJ137_17795 [Deltaproteobacteria bacterium]|nr:hypothetical protein [Deltaproteobacteria bacterium]